MRMLHPIQPAPKHSLTRAIKEYVFQSEGSTDLLAEVKDILIKETLDFNYGNQTATAKMLGINRGTLRKYLK